MQSKVSEESRRQAKAWKNILREDIHTECTSKYKPRAASTGDCVGVSCLPGTTCSDEDEDEHEHLPRLLPIQFETENVNRSSYFMMSVIVAIFLNLPLGILAVVLSRHAHMLILNNKGCSRSYRKAVLFGRLALFVNLLGIVSTMTILIYLFMCMEKIQHSTTKYSKPEKGPLETIEESMAAAASAGPS